MTCPFYADKLRCAPYVRGGLAFAQQKGQCQRAVCMAWRLSKKDKNLMGKKANTSFAVDFRRFFLRGLATLLPTVVTIVLLVKCFEFIQQNISVHINEGVIQTVILASDNYPQIDNNDIKKYITTVKPTEFDPENTKDKKAIRLWKLRDLWQNGPESLIGFGLAIVLVYIVGRLLASFLGRKLWQLFENTVQRIPGFKQVYPYIKQVTEFLFGENKIEFNRVVLVQYPRIGIWSIGLVTGAGMRHISDVEKQEHLTVFIPSSPTPVTGYVIHVKKEDIIDLPISLEEALRFTVSGGVIVPDGQALPTQEIEQKSGSATAEKS